jgi:hypothetical protein
MKSFQSFNIYQKQRYNYKLISSINVYSMYILLKNK